MGCCLALRCKLRSLSPQRCVREVFSLFGKGPGLALGCLANSSSPLSDPHSSTSFSAASWMPVCLPGVGLTSPRHQAKRAMEPLPAGPALDGRAALSKQTAGWAASHGQHGTCHYQSCIAGSLPKNSSRSNGLNLYVCVIRESVSKIIISSASRCECGFIYYKYSSVDIFPLFLNQ